MEPKELTHDIAQNIRHSFARSSRNLPNAISFAVHHPLGRLFQPVVILIPSRIGA
jgi:hypothetical protein